jgi:hypothetical protein
MKWIEDDEEILASLQMTTALLLKRIRSAKSKHGGSTIGRREIIRNRLQGHQQLYHDYFSDSPVYPDYLFRRRFRMQRSLFLKIVAAISEEDHYFVQRRDAARRLGFSPIQKATAAMRILAYGYSADSFDEYLRMSEFLFIF